jgi:NAD(P)-dependent dehydrogenase (short-subunit alcohol dehydrogenase family)/acyl carrier protein
VDLSRREDMHRAVAGSRQSNRTVTALDAHQLMVERPELFGRVLAQVCKHFRAGDFTTIPARVFPAAEAAAAIDASNAPGRVGAVAVCFDPDPDALLPAGPFHPKGTYLVTGGFGGFGLEIAAWMVGQGARNLVLAGRRGAATPEAKQAVDRLRRHGARVLPVAADISKEPDVERLLARIAKEMPPLKGVFHAAAVLEDSPIDQVDLAQIEHVMSAKALGAWHLHRHTQGSVLDYFVLFSSIASMVGGPGQASYAMSCACLDSLAHYRRARNLAATSIHWGALGQVGMAARHTEAEKYLSRSGVGSFTPAQAVKLLGRVLSWNPVELGVASMDWKLWGGAYPAWTVSPKYGALVVDEEVTDTQPANHELLRQLSELDPEKREGAIADVLAALLAETMQLAPEKIDRKLSLLSIGIDSLMAMELQASVEKKLAVKISMLELMKGNSLAQLAQHVALTMSVPRADAPAAADADAGDIRLPGPRLRRELHLEDAETIMAQLGDLTDDEVDLLIYKLVPKEGAEG